MATYKVKDGDTLGSIASMYGTTYQDLANLNGLSNPNMIYGGQELKLPDGTANSPTTEAQAGSPATGNSSGSVSVTVSSPFYGVSTATSNKLAELEGTKPTYGKSPALIVAEEQLAQYEKNKPAEYQSKYQEQIDSVLNSILNREKFSYDFNADPIYQQYKDQYINLGQQAMQDTMGNAAALTGGYGNSYASTAGNQAYQAYLNQLNNVIPELYNQAYNRYRDEGQDAYNRLGALQGLDESDYGRYRDTLQNYYNDLNYYYTKYNNMSQDEYNRYLNDLNAWANDRNYYYQMSQDEQAQANWNTQWEYQLAQDALKGSGGSGGGGRSGGSSGSSGSSRWDSDIYRLNNGTGQTLSVNELMSDVNSLSRSGANRKEVLDYLDELTKASVITPGEFETVKTWYENEVYGGTVSRPKTDQKEIKVKLK